MYSHVTDSSNATDRTTRPRSMLARARLRLGTATSSFAKSEDGAFLSWGMFTALGIFMATGLGLTMQLSEVHRAQLQNTLDRAVLAATDLDQQLAPAEVMADYVKRAGMEGVLDKSKVIEGLNFRTSQAEADITMNTIFVPGQPSWTIRAESEAFESVTDVEISLVLDISGSMRFGGRIYPLKTAAKNFIDMVLEGDRSDGTTVSIVPYAGQTNPGALLFEAMGGVRVHNNSSCAYLEAADFLHSGMPNSSTTQVPHFHKWDVDWNYMEWGWCPSEDMRIRPLQNDAEALKTFIDGMRLHDGTGTMNGMKYGLALLDPTSEPMLDVLQTAGQLPEIAHDRPRAWDAQDSVKYIVLMTDGKVTDQFVPKHVGFRDIDSDDEDNESGDRDDIDGIDHDLLNARVATNRQNTTSGKDQRVTSRSTNAANLYRICDQAKANGVVVFTIAFEADANGTEEMRTCASTVNHFFEVDQLEIGAAFSSIARTINQLRLTQ